MYEKRIECYNCIISILQRLMLPPAPKITSNKTKNKENYEMNKKELKKIIEIFEKSKDELFHFILYSWYINKSYIDELLNYKTKFLENFLLENNFYDLLWQYYSKNENYEKSSNILKILAEKFDIKIDLDKRIEYLSKSIINAKGFKFL
jgi:nuclear pore complex protein Nup155